MRGSHVSLKQIACKQAALLSAPPGCARPHDAHPLFPLRSTYGLNIHICSVSNWDKLASALIHATNIIIRRLIDETTRHHATAWRDSAKRLSVTCKSKAT